jgi:hypothetical protein
MSLVAGMAAGADSIEDLALLRHGAMGKVFDRPYAPSALGSFLRAFAFGHVRPLDAVAARFLGRLAARAPILPVGDGLVLVDVVDDAIVQVHGHAKQGAGFGYSRVRGLNALLATVATDTAAPLIVAQRLRKGSASSPLGAARLVADALAALRRVSTTGTGPVLMRADSAFFGSPTVTAAVRGGAAVSVTVSLVPRVRAAIATVGGDAWTPIAYREAVFDPDTGRWISRAEVAEVPFTAFASRPQHDQVTGRLVVRRIPDLNPRHGSQEPLFDSWRFHAFFTPATSTPSPPTSSTGATPSSSKSTPT